MNANITSLETLGRSVRTNGTWDLNPSQKSSSNNDSNKNKNDSTGTSTSTSLFERAKRTLDKYDSSTVKPILTVALLICYVIGDLLLRYVYIQIIDPALNRLGLNIDESVSTMMMKSLHLLFWYRVLGKFRDRQRAVTKDE